MYLKRPLVIASSFALYLSLTPIGSQAAGPAITTTTSTQKVNTILSGKTPPTSSLGKNGDFYIDTRTMIFYGPKANGIWPLGVSLKGNDGKDGADGKNGVDGKNGLDGSSISKAGATGATGLTGATGPVGPVGPAGPQGLKGDVGAIGLTGPQGLKGETGLTGATGPAGPQGLKGDTGLTGATGPAGPQGLKGDTGTAGATGATGPAGPQGLQGLQGATGATGSQGPQGLQGATGPAGATGATGPSRSYHGNISWSAPLAAASGSQATSQTFGNFEANKSYLVRVVIIGTIGSDADNPPVQLTISSNSGASVQSMYSVNIVKTYRSGATAKEVNIAAEIIVDGAAIATSHGLNAAVTHDTGLFSTISLTGSFIATQIGSAQ